MPIHGVPRKQIIDKHTQFCIYITFVMPVSPPPIYSQPHCLNLSIVGHTGTHLIPKVKQCWARLVLEWVTTQTSSVPGAVRKCTCILWPFPGHKMQVHRKSYSLKYPLKKKILIPALWHGFMQDRLIVSLRN
jgi:hypothetical protein